MPAPPLHHHGLPVQAINLDSAVEGILRSLRLPSFCCSKLVSLQPIHSPFGFGKYRLWPLHFAKSSNEIRQSRSLRIPPTIGFRINHTAIRLYSSPALSLFRSARSLHGLLKPTFCKRPRMVQPCLGPGCDSVSTAMGCGRTETGRVLRGLGRGQVVSCDTCIVTCGLLQVG